MEINALMMDPADNVVTCVADIPAGTAVNYRCGSEIRTLTAQENIPYCHKIALEDIREGMDVVKYGESLGHATQDIAKGHWVSHNNLISIPRDYDSEMI